MKPIEKKLHPPITNMLHFLRNFYLRSECKMRKYIVLFILSAAWGYANAEEKPTPLDNFDIIIASTWEHLEEQDKHSQRFTGKWIKLGTITFKKNSNVNVHLDEIDLLWKGDKIDSLEATLYKQKISNKSFLPIEENLICDGTWRKDKQELLLKFNKRESLASTNIFHLVITVSENLEKQLTNGEFELKAHCLPEPYKRCVNGQCFSIVQSKQEKQSTVH